MLGSLLRAASNLLRKRVREPDAVEPATPVKRQSVRPRTLDSDEHTAAARDYSYLASTSGCGTLMTCRPPSQSPRGTWALLPADLVLQFSDLLPLTVCLPQLPCSLCTAGDQTEMQAGTCPQAYCVTR